MSLMNEYIAKYVSVYYSTFSFVTRRDVNESHAAQPLSAVV